jgi:molecular chaperone HtpG
VSSPYRSGPGKKAPELAPEPGLVDEMVRQFADPHAFLRELVQNGIDAGAKKLIVTVDRDGDGVARTSVEDDGTGMTRAIIEGPLLTLFQSSKESDKTKIGKYGVGFLSVFATKPERVEVRTRTGTAGEAWVLTLFPDHSFELARDDAPFSGTGTVVTLVAPMDAEAFATHAVRAEASLRRWCRHAHVPIFLDGKEVNEPFDVEGLVKVTLEENGARYVAGAGRGGTFVGFYNRGLTLFETEEPEEGLVSVHVKIDAPTLSHTLSRDNVRRDAELRRVMRRAQALARGPLWDALAARIAEAAAAVASAPDAERIGMLDRLYDAALSSVFTAKSSAQITVPLLEPNDGKKLTTLRTLLEESPAGIETAHESSALTRALAAKGTLVVRSAALMPSLRGLALNRPVFDASTSWVYATTEDVAEHAEDEALLAEVKRLLARTGRMLGRAVLARYEGGGATGPQYRVHETSTKGGDGIEAMIARVQENETAWSRTSVLFLDVDDAVVRLARRRAKSDALVAGQLLVRAVLLTEGALKARDVDRLLEAAGDRTHG